MSKLSSPIVLIAIGLILGVAPGMFIFWKAALPLVAAAREAASKVGAPERPEAPWDFWTVEIENIATELKDSRALLKKRDDELTLREARFAAERLELTKQRQQLENLRTDISSRLIEIQNDEAKNLKSLAGTYSNLTPKATLTIFKEMDDSMVVKLLSVMKTDVVSPLFEEMSKQAATDPAIAKRAALLSEKLRLLKSAKTAGSP